MEIKNKEFKISVGTAITVVVSIIGFIYYASIRINTIENTLNQCKEVQLSNTEKITFNSRAIQEADLTTTEIRTKLASIEATLIEIKQSLIRHSNENNF